MKVKDLIKKTHPFTLITIRSKDMHPWEHILTGTPEQLLKSPHVCLNATVLTQLIVNQSHNTALMIIIR